MHHFTLRNGRYYYVRRVPKDLTNHFPSPTLWKSLHTSDKKQAAVASSSYEFQTSQLFLQLRTGMLTPDLEKRLVAAFLAHGASRIQAQATGTKIVTPDAISPIDKVFATQNKSDLHLSNLAQALMPEDTSPDQIKLKLGQHTKHLKERLQTKNIEYATVSVDPDYLQEQIKQLAGVKLTKSELKVLCLKLIDSQIQLNEAEYATYDGNWSQLRTLQQSTESVLKEPYVKLSDMLELYMSYYRADRIRVSSGGMRDMEVECQTLLEITGNISLEAFNSMETVTKVKTVLRKYPLNRQQRYKGLALSSILKLRDYDKIQPVTANEYIKRAKAVVDYALKCKKLSSANVWVDETFETSVPEEDQRKAYDDADVKRLIDALCTKPLWVYAPEKPERFWLVLIALFHGLRLGNITALTKQDIVKMDNGLWCFRLRKGKTKATVRPVAICDALILLGFLEWVETLPREQLFQDTAKSFTAWYNHDEKRKDGYISQGFEPKYVTNEKGKCLHSIRHTFAGNVWEVSSDLKVTADMMGHSTSGSVTGRYAKATKAAKLKEVSEKMSMDAIDLNRLEGRAIELFGLN